MAYTPLINFSCGGTESYEREVDELVEDLVSGRMDWEVVRLAENEHGSLVGLCVIDRRSLGAQVPEAAYIALIAIAEGWRGYRLPSGERIGSFMLGDALKQIFQIWNAPPMPAVCAAVVPGNIASHNVFADWGFGYIAATSENQYDVRYRRAGLGLRRSGG